MYRAFGHFASAFKIIPLFSIKTQVLLISFFRTILNNLDICINTKHPLAKNAFTIRFALGKIVIKILYPTAKKQNDKKRNT
jgi:hypothetical protein